MRLAFGVQYLGKNYYGWQIQPNVPTIQSELEYAFSQVADEKIDIIGAGLTDTGVHASGQVAHFDTEAIRDTDTWQRGANRFLPDDINITGIIEVPDSFHARFSAIKRQYKFLIYNSTARSSCFYPYATQEYLPLDENLMDKAAKLLVGEHDFSAVRDSNCQSNSPIRVVYDAGVKRYGEFIVFTITANAYLHHMVRNLMGVLIPIGSTKEPVRWISDVLASKDRKQAGVTYSPHGLYLHRIQYPDVFSFQIPRQNYIIDLIERGERL